MPKPCDNSALHSASITRKSSCENNKAEAQGCPPIGSSLGPVHRLTQWRGEPSMCAACPSVVLCSPDAQSGNRGQSAGESSVNASSLHSPCWPAMPHGRTGEGNPSRQAGHASAIASRERTRCRSAPSDSKPAGGPSSSRAGPAWWQRARDATRSRISAPRKPADDVHQSS